MNLSKYTIIYMTRQLKSNPESTFPVIFKQCVIPSFPKINPLLSDGVGAGGKGCIMGLVPQQDSSSAAATTATAAACHLVT